MNHVHSMIAVHHVSAIIFTVFVRDVHIYYIRLDNYIHINVNMIVRKKNLHIVNIVWHNRYIVRINNLCGIMAKKIMLLIVPSRIVLQHTGSIWTSTC
ncbi:hypothetical protein BLA29_012354 [Euroglyphus maynei]|uniref:Uncharacterized protein n=1 Tax=Euroglyphus maynei TaxID=6958 RepID=A0A1Y3ATT7_EURMA|nr:hypothetical protein BLA29_012354 [Euroglyphus maynei]